MENIKRKKSTSKLFFDMYWNEIVQILKVIGGVVAICTLAFLNAKFLLNANVIDIQKFFVVQNDVENTKDVVTYVNIFLSLFLGFIFSCIEILCVVCIIGLVSEIKNACYVFSINYKFLNRLTYLPLTENELIASEIIIGDDAMENIARWWYFLLNDIASPKCTYSRFVLWDNVYARIKKEWFLSVPILISSQTGYDANDCPDKEDISLMLKYLASLKEGTKEERIDCLKTYLCVNKAIKLVNARLQAASSEQDD